MKKIQDPICLAWCEIKDSFTPNSVPLFISDQAFENATGWLLNNSEDGICWIEHVAFGERLAEYSGFDYYGEGDKASSEILTANKSVIASYAHAVGKNLQRFNKNLIVSPPTSGKLWEQLLGRTHRFGQQADEVNVDCFLYTREQKDSFKKAQEEATYVQETTGQKQKLLYADITFPQ